MHIASYNCIAFQILVFIFIIAIVILLSAHQSSLCLKLKSFFLWMVVMVITVIMAIMVTRYLSPWSHWLQDIDYLAVTLPSP